MAKRTAGTKKKKKLTLSEKKKQLLKELTMAQLGTVVGGSCAATANADMEEAFDEEFPDPAPPCSNFCGCGAE